jgi:hypothetical protein
MWPVLGHGVLAIIVRHENGIRGPELFPEVGIAILTAQLLTRI